MNVCVFQGALKKAKAPFVPEASVRMGKLIDELKGLKKGDKRFSAIVKELTHNFDEFEEGASPCTRET